MIIFYRLPKFYVYIHENKFVIIRFFEYITKNSRVKCAQEICVIAKFELKNVFVFYYTLFLYLNKFILTENFRQQLFLS